MANTVFYNAHAPTGAVLVLFDSRGVISSCPLGMISSVGRGGAGASCDVIISSPVVSRRHAEIVCVNGEYYYRDLGSTNGTYVNNTLIGRDGFADKQTCSLRDGDILRFDISGEVQNKPEPVYALFALHCGAENEWSRLALTDEMAEICIGRSASSGLRISDNTVSEKHASFFSSSNGWAVIDHQSTNGVFLRGKKMTSPRYLRPYDVVRITGSYFIFTGDALLYSGASMKENEAAAPSSPITVPQPAQPPVQPAQPPVQPRQSTAKGGGELQISITERSVVSRFKKLMLLQNINMTVSNGEMVLILGGSGAGKTTFINAVMGYEKASGRIMYRDTDIYEEYEQMKYDIGFVPQQDLLRGSDTVLDTISNAAEMKLPRSMSADARDKRIDKVLEDLGLSREKETLVSKLSGGQRKRLSIAVEFVSDPSLFFLDEPDSGVDDIMGRGLMENLRLIADRGKIVMVITHSPERAADLFDKVIVLAKSTKDNCGHLAFYGSVSDAFGFFGVSSFREIVKKINRPDENGEGLSDFYIDKYASYTGG